MLLPLLRDLALAQSTASPSTCEEAAKTYAAIINKQPDSETLLSTVTSDLEHVWARIKSGIPEEKQRAVTALIWVRRRFCKLYLELNVCPLSLFRFARG